MPNGVNDNIGSGKPPAAHQDIIWSKFVLVLIELLGTDVNGISMKTIFEKFHFVIFFMKGDHFRSASVC